MTQQITHSLLVSGGYASPTWAPSEQKMLLLLWTVRRQSQTCLPTGWYSGCSLSCCPFVVAGSSAVWTGKSLRRAGGTTAVDSACPLCLKWKAARSVLGWMHLDQDCPG